MTGAVGVGGCYQLNVLQVSPLLQGAEAGNLPHEGAAGGVRGDRQHPLPLLHPLPRQSHPSWACPDSFLTRAEEASPSNDDAGISVVVDAVVDVAEPYGCFLQ